MGVDFNAHVAYATLFPIKDIPLNTDEELYSFFETYRHLNYCHEGSWDHATNVVVFVEATHLESWRGAVPLEINGYDIPQPALAELEWFVQNYELEHPRWLLWADLSY